jgi:hypothetical protein
LQTNKRIYLKKKKKKDNTGITHACKSPLTISLSSLPTRPIMSFSTSLTPSNKKTANVFPTIVNKKNVDNNNNNDDLKDFNNDDINNNISNNNNVNNNNNNNNSNKINKNNGNLTTTKKVIEKNNFRKKIIDTEELYEILNLSKINRKTILDEYDLKTKQLNENILKNKSAYKIHINLLKNFPVTQKQQKIVAENALNEKINSNKK